MKGYIQDDKNTIRLPRQELSGSHFLNSRMELLKVEKRFF